MQRKHTPLIELTFILLLTTVLMGTQNARMAKALGTNVRIEAPETVQAGSTFNISIIGENIPNQEGGLAGWQLVLRWTPNAINCTEETINYGYWSDHLGPFFDCPIDNEAGCYTQALTLKSPATPVTGTYWLVNLTFSSSATASSAGSILKIEADDARGLQYVLLDQSNNYILHNYVNGQINIRSWARNLSILNLTAIPDSIYLGDIVNIDVAVQNNGDMEETFNVTVYANATMIHTQTVSDLLPTRHVVVTCVWNTADASVGTYSIVAQVNTVPNETHIDDNVRVKEVALVPELDSTLVLGIFVVSLLVAVFRKKIHRTVLD